MAKINVTNTKGNDNLSQMKSFDDLSDFKLDWKNTLLENAEVSLFALIGNVNILVEFSRL